MLTNDATDANWERWLDEARRGVLAAAETYVYITRYGWVTPEHLETLTDAVDALAVLNHDYVRGHAVESPTIRNESAASDALTD